MNLYLRYFDQETLVNNVDEAIDFLKGIPEIGMDAELEADIRDYAASDVCYPKRYKVRPRIVEHLKERVDSRSQFPSAKGKNFHFRYLGMWK